MIGDQDTRTLDKTITLLVSSQRKALSCSPGDASETTSVITVMHGSTTMLLPKQPLAAKQPISANCIAHTNQSSDHHPLLCISIMLSTEIPLKVPPEKPLCAPICLYIKADHALGSTHTSVTHLSAM